MNRNKLKTYAPQARRQFIQMVTDRAAVYGLSDGNTEPMQVHGDVAIIAGHPFPAAVADTRKRLEERIERHGFEQTMEAMAYTWFNRFAAIRYMELHGYLDHGYRVLSNPNPAKTTPEIIEHAEHLELPGLSRDRVIELKLDGTKEAELYRHLLIAQCNALSHAMPFLFERIVDETELLLPDNLLHSDSVIRKLVGEIDEPDWEQVEIIGWLYQFYISEKKDEVIGSVVKSEDIPAATQLFTPNWIVKYLVQNSLGRKWLETYPGSPLRQKMEFYIEPAEQTQDVQAQLKAITPDSLNPEELTLMDPACGSGHILVEAYDLLKEIYLERGYRLRDIPKLILTKNLFGLEIDDRAAQLAAFAVMMKARADDRRLFDDEVCPHVLGIQESNDLDVDAIVQAFTEKRITSGSDLVANEFGIMGNVRALLFATENRATATADEKLAADLKALFMLFENAKTFGSLLTVPQQLTAKLPMLIAAMADMNAAVLPVASLAKRFVNQAALLAQRYDAVVTNPPYMGSSFYNQRLKSFVNGAYQTGKSDLYACFVLRNLEFALRGGFVAMITIPNWMFLTRFEDFRDSLLSGQYIDTLVHNGRGVWGSDFGSCSFVVRAHDSTAYTGTYKRLFSTPGSVATVDELRQRFFDTQQYMSSSDDFRKIPGCPIVYWASEAIRALFSQQQPLGRFIETREGLATADNDLFLRRWSEVDLSAIFFNCSDNAAAISSRRKWFSYVKGGPYRKWYGNTDLVVNWQCDGQEVKANIDLETGRVRSHNYNGDYAFRDGFSWSGLSIAALSVRYVPPGFMFDAKGPMAFAADRRVLLYAVAVLNSEFGRHLMTILAPTVDFKLGHIMKVPIDPKASVVTEVIQNAESCVELACLDWNSRETAWDFKRPLCLLSGQKSHTMQASLDASRLTCQQWREKLKSLEEANNAMLIASYGLTNELKPAVDPQSLTIGVPETRELCEEVISYAVGCAMGRYSLDRPGMIYANSGNQGFDQSQYKTFHADADGIIPATEIDWFTDDATHRFEEFVGAAWPKEHLEENLKFAGENFGIKSGEQSRDTIRRYYATGFYKDHLQTYKRRPIYWLFTSGKLGAFQCLVYLHRYNEGTLARMRTEYVIPLQGKIASRIEQLEGDKSKSTSTAHQKRLEKEQDLLKKQQAELLKFEEKLRHYADQRINLDLDDGVKVNYAKFGDLLAEVQAVCGKGEEDD